MMAYSNRFVVSILVNGKIQKELNDSTVELPFDTEYSIRFRNKHRDRRAVVKLYIDGEEQSKNGYVIQPNSYVDIERNSYSPRKFLFVAPDSTEAQDFGKDPENKDRLNGVIEARFYLEKAKPVEVHHHHHHEKKTPWYRRRDIHHHHHHYDGHITNWDMTWFSDPTTDDCPPIPSEIHCCGGGGTTSSAVPPTIQYQAGGVVQPETAPADAELLNSSFGFADAAPTAKRCRAKREVTPGVTVEGSYSSQRFRKVDIDLEEQFTTVKVFLRGHQQEEIAEIQEGGGFGAVKGGYCPNCGAKRKPAKANFCHVCGHKY